MILGSLSTGTILVLDKRVLDDLLFDLLKKIKKVLFLVKNFNKLNAKFNLGMNIYFRLFNISNIFIDWLISRLRSDHEIN